MAKVTLQEKFITALKQRGGHEVPTRSTRKLTAVSAHDDPGKYYFVGKAGAVRYGRIASDSVALSDPTKKELLKEYKEVETQA